MIVKFITECKACVAYTPEEFLEKKRKLSDDSFEAYGETEKYTQYHHKLSGIKEYTVFVQIFVKTIAKEVV